MPVVRTEDRTVSRSRGRSDRTSTTSTSIPSPETRSAASSAYSTIKPYATTVTCEPGRRIAADPRGTT